MSSRIRLLLAVVIGGLLGAGGVWLSSQRKAKMAVIDSAYSRMVDGVTVLSWARRDSYKELIDYKERGLNADLFALSVLVKPESLSEKEHHYLLMAVRYRMKHPFDSGDPEIDSQINELLNLIKSKNPGALTDSTTPLRTNP